MDGASQLGLETSIQPCSPPEPLPELLIFKPCYQHCTAAGHQIFRRAVWGWQIGLQSADQRTTIAIDLTPRTHWVASWAPTNHHPLGAYLRSCCQAGAAGTGVSNALAGA